MKIKLPIFSHEILKAEKGWICEVANEKDRRKMVENTKAGQRLSFFFSILPFHCHIVNDLPIICSLPLPLNEAWPFLYFIPVFTPTFFTVIRLPCRIDRNTSFVTAIINQLSCYKTKTVIANPLAINPWSLNFLFTRTKPATYTLYLRSHTHIR